MTIGRTIHNSTRIKTICIDFTIQIVLTFGLVFDFLYILQKELKK